jgi:hypothetical protein
VEGDTDEDEDEDIDDEGWEDKAEGPEETSDVYYLDPGLAIALRATCPNLSANQIIEKYKVPELIPALTKLLKSQIAKANG